MTVEPLLDFIDVFIAVDCVGDSRRGVLFPAVCVFRAAAGGNVAAVARLNLEIVALNAAVVCSDGENCVIEHLQNHFDVVEGFITEIAKRLHRRPVSAP